MTAEFERPRFPEKEAPLTIPKHLVIIPDGNGRWAQRKNLPISEGHKKGAQTTLDLIRQSRELAIPVVTLWGFSTENWQRPSKETQAIFSIASKIISRNLEELNQEGVMIMHAGRKDRLPESLLKHIKKAETETRDNTKQVLVLALDYGGRNEIVRATQRLIDQGNEKVDEEAFLGALDTAGLPDPDLIIRTAGEMRTSGIFPFQSAYAEYVGSPILYPDFTKEDLIGCLKEFSSRKRRFGRRPELPNKKEHPLSWITDQKLTLENLQKGYIRIASESLPSLFSDFASRESALDPFVAHMFEDYSRVLSGGRKIRGLLSVVSFSISGGEPDYREAIIQSSLAYEMLHNAFLIHDDIEDNSPTRRNQPSLHVAYEHLARESGAIDAPNLGKALALNVGDKGPALAFLIVLGTDLPPHRKISAVRHLSEIISDTVSGQAIDISRVSLEELTRRKIYQIDVFKTAKYTFAGPLKMGSIMSGASKKEQQLYAKFGLPLGISFQIHDDIAGIFGNPEELGKPTDSDIKEAKKTLLFWYAFTNGSQKHREILRSTWGKQSISEQEMDQVKDVLLTSGAVEHSFNNARALVSQAKKFIPKITSNRKTQEVLEQIADFSISNYRSIANLSPK